MLYRTATAVVGARGQHGGYYEMVTTRSGSTVRHHAVRFKKGAAVRKVLEFCSDSWGYEAADADSEGSSDEPAPLANGGILLNGTRNDSSPHNQPYAEIPTREESLPDLDTTVPYDINGEERRQPSWLWDALLFVMVTLACFFAVFLTCEYALGLNLENCVTQEAKILVYFVCITGYHRTLIKHRLYCY